MGCPFRSSRGSKLPFLKELFFAKENNCGEYVATEDLVVMSDTEVRQTRVITGNRQQGMEMGFRDGVCKLISFLDSWPVVAETVPHFLDFLPI